MSGTTQNLGLFKYNTATDGKEVFSIDQAMNENWDKIDSFAAAIKSLSNLDTVGEKRFSDINTELAKKLEAQVLLAENGYIKFNNRITIQYGRFADVPTNGKAYNFPISFQTACRTIVCTANTLNDIGSTSTSIPAYRTHIKNNSSVEIMSSINWSCRFIAIGY